MENGNQNYATLLICCFLISLISTNDEVRPLNFEFSADNPLKARIYLNPLASIKKIRELASREVFYTENNVTRDVEEETGEWYTLVAEDDNVSPRFALIKNDRCNEKDFRLTWLDDKDHVHSNVLQRLGPSPVEFPENNIAKIRASQIHFDQDKVIVHLEYPTLQEIIGSNPKNFLKPGNLTPVVQLDNCLYLFEKPQRQPKLSDDQKSIIFDIAYADHFCTFWVHLSFLSFDRDKECFQMFQTSGGQSDKISLKCGEQSSHPCPEVKQQSQSSKCKLNCDLTLTTSAEYKYPTRGSPFPIVKLEWSPKSGNTAADTPIVAKITAIDIYYNNFALGETNATKHRLNGSYFELRPASKKDETLYAARACQIDHHDKECENFEPDWALVPQNTIYATKLMRELGPPGTSTTPLPKATPTMKHDDNVDLTDKPVESLAPSKMTRLSLILKGGTTTLPASPSEHLHEHEQVLKHETHELNESIAETAKPTEAPVHQSTPISGGSESGGPKEKDSGSKAASLCSSGFAIIAALIIIYLKR